MIRAEKKPSPSTTALLATMVVAAIVLGACSPSAAPTSRPKATTAAFYVQSASMIPILKIGDRIVIATSGYVIRRGDLVVFKRPPADIGTGDAELVMRVIALPGETIAARGNIVLIDGRPLHESWLPTLKGVCAESAENIPPTRIPSAHYFVMGDCRGDSADSRTWGSLAVSLIVGKVLESG